MTTSEKPNFGPDSFTLTPEGGKNFVRYLKKFDLFKEPEILIISPRRLFYYDENELKEVKTFVVIKKLNLIKDLDNTLKSISSILPADVNFIGCFSENKLFRGDGFFFELRTIFTNLLDLRTYRNLDKNDVSELLTNHGFRVVDISEINGLTFFCSKNVRQSIETKI